MKNWTLDTLRGEAIAAADAVDLDFNQIEELSASRFDTAFKHLTPKELRKLRDSLRELKHNMERSVNRYWDRRDKDVQLERKAENIISEQIRKDRGILVGRDPLGRRVEPDPQDEWAE